MVRASAYPTVEWLTTSAAKSFSPTAPASGRAAVRNSRTGLLDRVARRLIEWKLSRTEILRDVWVRTPNGEEPVGLVLQHGNRRIGIRLSARYERETDQSDALVLVYGRFDTLYRVSPDSESDFDTDLAYTIVSMVPAWFTPPGRCRAGRAAGTQALLGADRLALTGVVHLPGGTVTRIRLSRASDWVSAFENALSIPRLRSFADGRVARAR